MHSSLCCYVQGVTPATIAVRDGVCRVGFSSEELVDLAKAGPEGRAKKCSTRELSLIMASQTKHHAGPHQWGGRDDVWCEMG